MRIVWRLSERRRRVWKRRNERRTTRGVGSRVRIGIRRAGRPYKRAYGEPDEKAQSNFTDPESGIMQTSNEGYQAVLQRAGGGGR